MKGPPELTENGNSGFGVLSVAGRLRALTNYVIKFFSHVRSGHVRKTLLHNS